MDRAKCLKTPAGCATAEEIVLNQTEITVVVDNRAGAPSLFSEHGFALWIDAGAVRILFDCGQGPALRHNAEKLGIPLEQADSVVLSHGHYDHTGGAAEALAAAKGARLIAAPGFLEERFSIHPGKGPKAIGMPPVSRSAAAALEQGRVVSVDKPFRITSDIGVTGPVPRETDFEDEGGPFFFDRDGKVRDPIPEDQALWLNTAQGLIICVGCCHAGLVNTVRYITELSGSREILLIVGGLHLVSASESRLAATCQALQSFRPQCIVPCHCTGESGVSRLVGTFGSTIVEGASGFKWTLSRQSIGGV